MTLCSSSYWNQKLTAFLGFSYADSDHYHVSLTLTLKCSLRHPVLWDTTLNQLDLISHLSYWHGFLIGLLASFPALFSNRFFSTKQVKWSLKKKKKKKKWILSLLCSKVPPLDWGQSPKSLRGRTYKFAPNFCHIDVPTCVHPSCHSLWLIHTALLTGSQMFWELFYLVDVHVASWDCLEYFSSLFG